jgi:hypothetical protein
MHKVHYWGQNLCKSFGQRVLSWQKTLLSWVHSMWTWLWSWLVEEEVDGCTRLASDPHYAKNARSFQVDLWFVPRHSARHIFQSLYLLVVKDWDRHHWETHLQMSHLPYSEKSPTKSFLLTISFVFPLFFFFFCCCFVFGTGAWTQGLMLVGQATTTWGTSPSLLLTVWSPVPPVKFGPRLLLALGPCMERSFWLGCPAPHDSWSPRIEFFFPSLLLFLGYLLFLYFTSWRLR